MTGLKSGAGDDLWGDDSGDSDDADSDEEASSSEDSDAERSEPTETSVSDQVASSDTESTEEDTSTSTVSASKSESGSTSRDSNDQNQPYIVRRAIQDKSVQFERDERLTFFVHDDVVNGERDLILELESALGRDVPKFDVREAVYRAALENRDDVLEELLEMGYSLDED